MDTTTSNGRAILKCTACKRSGNVSYTITSTLREFNNRPSRSSVILVEGATRPSLMERGFPTERYLWRACSCGSTRVKVSIVKGSYNPDKACNDRCMGATGPACDCSCGGENHGGGHSSF